MPTARLRSSTRISCSSAMWGTMWRDLARCSCFQGSELCRLGSQRLDSLVEIDCEAGVGAGADLVDLVLGSDLEHHLAPVDLRHGDGDLDRGAHEGGGEVLECNLHSDRVLSFIAVLDHEIAAGHLDVADQPWCGINARLFAHEADGAVTVDGDAVGPRHAGAESVLHAWAPGLVRAAILAA